MTASGGRSSALFGLLKKETYHILRDRRTLVVITLMPILQVIIFGYAIRTDVDHVRLAIVDPAPDYATLALRGRFGATDVISHRRRRCPRPPTSIGCFSGATRRRRSCSSPDLRRGLGRGFRRGCRSSPTRQSQTPEARFRHTRSRSFRATSARSGPPRAPCASSRRCARGSIPPARARTCSCRG